MNAPMESNVPGIYVAGTAVAGNRASQFKTFLENCRQHVEKIVAHLAGGPATSRNAAFERQIKAAPES